MKQIICDYIQELYNSGKKVFIWFRDDDVGEDTEKFHLIIDYFTKRKTEILMAVIPGCLDKETIITLQSVDGITVGQHGYSHIDYSLEGESKSEFPQSRNPVSALKEIELGRTIMKEMFHENYDDVFVPPYFEIDKYVLTKIKNLYKWFSCWWTNSINDDCIFVNAQVDFIDWNKDKKYGGSRFVEEQFFRELKLLGESSYLSTVIGVVLHHDYCETETYEELDWLFNLNNLFKNVCIISPNQAYELVCSRKVMIN